MTLSAIPSLAKANARGWATTKGVASARRGDRESIYHSNGRPLGVCEYAKRVTPNWRWDWPHLRHIGGVLDRVTAGELTRVIMQVPPRHGKTELGTVRYALQRLELDPTLRIIIAAYNDTLARKFSRKIRRLARGRLQLSEDKTAVEDWETEQGGGVRAVGLRGGVTGQGADLLIIDDPVKNRREAESLAFRDDVFESYTDDFYTRLEPGAAIVLTMTRWHEDDLVGRILASEDGSSWKVIKLAALAEPDDPLGRPVGAALCPDRYDETALAKRKQVLGARSFEALFQQNPSPASGFIFQGIWWRYYTTRDRPIINADGTRVPTLPDVWSSHLQSWDMSFKDKADSDFVCGQIWSRLGADCYLRTQVYDRMDFTKSIAAVLRLSAEWPDARLKLVEDKANGPAIISALRTKIQGLVAVEPKGDKVSRAWAVTPICESGNVWLPHPQIAPWVERLKLSLVQFPNGAHDDDVDALTQALTRLATMVEQRPANNADVGESSEAARVANTRYR